MTVLFLAALIAGLLLAVRAMLYGVERGEHPFGEPVPTPAPVRMWEPVASAFAMVFGVVGYLVSRPGRLPFSPGMLVAVLAGGVAAALAVRVVRGAVAFIPEHDPDDPRYVLQGHVAVVTAPIDGASAGAIEFVVEGRHRKHPAVGLDGSAAEVGSEVVIEKIDEAGVAHVEPWDEVEKRI
jgi:hypothetical protein